MKIKFKMTDQVLDLKNFDIDWMVECQRNSEAQMTENDGVGVMIVPDDKNKVMANAKEYVGKFLDEVKTEGEDMAEVVETLEAVPQESVVRFLARHIDFLVKDGRVSFAQLLIRESDFEGLTDRLALGSDTVKKEN